MTNSATLSSVVDHVLAATVRSVCPASDLCLSALMRLRLFLQARAIGAARRFQTGLLVALSLFGAAQAQTVIDPELNESIEMIQNNQLFSVGLETTFFKPGGAGPFPVVVINHGKSRGESRMQERSRPISAVRYFLQRGYVVVVPMRQGFSKSGGSYIGSGCNVEGNGRAQAKDVKAVVDHVVAQPWANRDQLLILGQSHGGWTTLAFGAINYPGVRGLVNFAGGLRQETCVAWEAGLASGAAAYAKETRQPSLWFYGDNDSFFGPGTFRPMYERYTAAGGSARLVAFGQFGNDAHSLFGSPRGAPIWQPELSQFLQSVGLPYQPQAQYARFAGKPVMATPAPSNFANLNDSSKLPFVRDSGRAGYETFLGKEQPRAFALAPSGAWGWAEGGDDPLKRALDNCNRNSKTPCRLYAVDDQVVWAPD
jgi:dienelactone hydrolase